MNNTLVTTICIAAALVVCTILFKECGKSGPSITKIETTKYLHDTVYKYDKNKFRDTFTRIRDRYRVLLDTVERFHYDSTWGYVCRMLPDSQTGEGCQREVVRRLISGRLNEELIGVYQNQRFEDSSQIAFMFQLDSLTTEAHLSEVKGLKGEIAQVKRKSGRKTVKFALGGALVGFILGKI